MRTSAENGRGGMGGVVLPLSVRDQQRDVYVDVFVACLDLAVHRLSHRTDSECRYLAEWGRCDDDPFRVETRHGLSSLSRLTELVDRWHECGVTQCTSERVAALLPLVQMIDREPPIRCGTARWLLCNIEPRCQTTPDWWEGHYRLMQATLTQVFCETYLPD